jgi:hypothetical protein
MSVIVHYWPSESEAKTFACGRPVKAKMLWDIRPLTKAVLKEHRLYTRTARLCKTCSRNAPAANREG